MKRWPLALGALVALLALVETAVALTAQLRVAKPAEWEAAAAEVRGGFRDGDLIVFAPAWVDPIGRAHLGDLVPPEMAGRADDDRYRRIWEVSIRGARAKETAGLTAQETTSHGRVRVALYEKTAVDVAYDFTSHSGEATVLDANRHPCLPAGNGAFNCQGGRVEPRTLEIDYQPHRGILLPLAQASLIDLDFTGVPGARTLVVYTGIHDYYSRKNGHGLVTLTITIHDAKDRARARGLSSGNDDGWKRTEIDVHDLEPPLQVSFHASAPNPAWRTFGFHAEARK